MAKKKIGVTLEETLHWKVKSAASANGTTIEEAYDQALKRWLGEAQVQVEPLLWPLMPALNAAAREGDTQSLRMVESALRPHIRKIEKINQETLKTEKNASNITKTSKKHA